MSPRTVRAAADQVRRAERPLTVTVDGEPVTGAAGQTLAGVLLGAGRVAWRSGPSGAPRGVFCGIGVCFDCLVTVNSQADVRACRRTAVDGDEVTTQRRTHHSAEGRGDRPGHGPAADEVPAEPTDRSAESS